MNFHSASSMGSLPKMHFPHFDGDSPRLWVSRSEDYFDMYGVDLSLWIKIASMHFSDSAAQWLQSVERHVKSLNWVDFCKLILERFGKEHHELLIRQLFSMKQSSTVKDYVDRFTALVDQLAAYESRTNPLYYTMKFIDGLRDDLKFVVIMQRPSNLDTVCVLAQLQKDVTTLAYKRDYRCQEYTASLKPV